MVCSGFWEKGRSEDEYDVARRSSGGERVVHACAVNELCAHVNLTYQAISSAKFRNGLAASKSITDKAQRRSHCQLIEGWFFFYVDFYTL